MPDSSRAPDRLARCHAFSGLILSLFIALHLLNHAAAFGGPTAYANFRALLRHIYQQPVFEALCLAGPLLFSSVTGFMMGLRRIAVRADKDAARPPGLRQHLHRWSGVCLLLLVLPHALSTRGVALLWNIEPDFHFIAQTMAGPRGLAAGFLYALLVVAASYHLANGLFTLLDDSGVFPGRATRWAGAAVFLFVGAVLLVCGMLGALSYGGVIYPRPGIEPLPLE